MRIKEIQCEAQIHIVCAFIPAFYSLLHFLIIYIFSKYVKLHSSGTTENS